MPNRLTGEPLRCTTKIGAVRGSGECVSYGHNSKLIPESLKTNKLKTGFHLSHTAKDSDKLIKGSSKNTDKQLQCQYGRLAMNVGDRLETEVTDQYTYECSCQIPPLAQCVMTKLQKE